MARNRHKRESSAPGRGWEGIYLQTKAPLPVHSLLSTPETQMWMKKGIMLEKTSGVEEGGTWLFPYVSTHKIKNTYILMKEDVTWRMAYTQCSFKDLSSWLIQFASIHKFTSTYILMKGNVTGKMHYTHCCLKKKITMTVKLHFFLEPVGEGGIHFLDLSSF